MIEPRRHIGGFTRNAVESEVRAMDEARSFDDQRFIARMRTFEACMEGLSESLADALERCRTKIRQAEDSSAIRAILDGAGPERVTRRRALNESLAETEKAMQLSRGESIRIAVDSGVLTITEAARVTGISTQMARRLYRRATESPL